ncbi:MAG: dihydroorotase [Acidimicrobiia bacterium]|nr:dihydroorotase [Acidimicrobiia bacterium]
MSEFTLRNAVVVGRDGVLPGRNDVAVADGVIVDVGSDIAAPGESVDCEGAWVGPGFVDLHTHLREPGQEWKEDIETGSRAAALGGYTAVVAMPNTEPATDAGHLARYVADRGAQVGLVEVVPGGTITAGRAGIKLAHLDDLWSAGVTLFTDDGDSVADAGLLRRAMEYLAERDGVVAQHCIDAGLAAGGQMHEGAVSSRLGMAGVPRAAEEIVIARDLSLVRLTGVRYHVQHVSTAGAMDLVAAAKAEGLRVTAEVTPHHLLFDHSYVEQINPLYKMMPPLREPSDLEALREGLRTGAIDVVATDHAPHADHEKDHPWEEAPFGVTGVEWAAAVTNTVVELDAERFFAVMSTKPAEIADLDGQGVLEVGAAANLVVFDPLAKANTTRTASRSTNSPYLGRDLNGAVRHTIFKGEFTVRDGSVDNLVGAPE